MKTRRIFAFVLMLAMLFACVPAGTGIAEEERTVGAGGLVIDSDSAGGYTGDYVVIYNPSTDPETQYSTGSLTGRIETELDTDIVSGRGEAKTDEPYILDVDAEIEALDREALGEDYGSIPTEGGTRTSFSVGSTRTFKITYKSPGDEEILFKVLAKGQHCYIWTPYYNYTNFWPLDSIDPSYAQLAAAEFDRMYELMNTSFGAHSNGSEGDGRVSLMFFNIDDGYEYGVSTSYTGGYFSSSYYNTNGLPMICIDTWPMIYFEYPDGTVKNDISSAYSVACHEYQHCINYSNGGMALWLNESFSSAAQEICYPGSCAGARIQSWIDYKYSVNDDWLQPPAEFPYRDDFEVHNGFSLYSWDQSSTGLLALYARELLFSQYLYTNWGNTIYKRILNKTSSGYTEQEAFEAVLGMSYSDLVRDFYIALYANDLAYSPQYGFAPQPGYDPAGYHNVQDQYNLLGPVVYTGSGLYLHGGSAICVKPVNGVFTPPASASSNLRYFGITRNITPQSVESAYLTPESASIAVGDNAVLRLGIEPYTASGFNVYWSSSNSGVAQVSGNSSSVTVTGISRGTAYITAEIADSATDETLCTAEALVLVGIPVKYVPTDTVEPGVEYLIGCDTGSGVYVLMNYNPDPLQSSNGNPLNFFFSSDYSYYGYGIEAVTDESGSITGIDNSVYPDALMSHVEWIFGEAGSGWNVYSGRNASYRLGVYISGSSSGEEYYDLYAGVGSSLVYDYWYWDAQNHDLYFDNGSVQKHAAYVAAVDGCDNVFGAFTTPPNSTPIQLYKKVYMLESEPVTGITVEPQQLGIYAGETAEVSLHVTPAEAFDYTVEWSSADASVAYVTGGNSGASVIGVSQGNTTVTVTVTDNTTREVFTEDIEVEVTKQLLPPVYYMPTDEIVTGEEYLIGFDTGDGVCLIMNSNPDPISGNGYYYSYNSNYYGYGIMAVTDEYGNIVALDNSVYPDANTINVEWIFENYSGGGYRVASCSDSSRQLAAYGSANYEDLFPSQSSSSSYVGVWAWQAYGDGAGTLYAAASSSVTKYASYAAEVNGNNNFFRAVTAHDSTCAIRLYRKAYAPSDSEVESVSIDPSVIRVNAGSQAAARLVVEPADAEQYTVTWSLREAGAAIMQANGARAIVTGVTPGVSVLCAEVYDLLSGNTFCAEAPILVTEAPQAGDYMFVPTDSVELGVEYLIGCDTGEGVYLLMNYNPDPITADKNYYYTVGGNYYGYGVLAVTDGAGNVTGVDTSTYPDALMEHVEWIFENGGNGLMIASVFNDGYYLRIYNSANYSDLYAGTLNSAYCDGWNWDGAAGSLYFSSSDATKYAAFLPEANGYTGFFHAPAQPDEQYGCIRLYKKQYLTQEQVFALTVEYVFEDGTAALPSAYYALHEGDPFTIEIPELEGYTAAASVTEGVMPGHDLTVRVTYTEAVSAGIIGDVNNDGDVNFADVTFLYMYLLGLGDVDEQGRLNADIDGSGQIDFVDVTMLYSMLLMG